MDTVPLWQLEPLAIQCVNEAVYYTATGFLSVCQSVCLSHADSVKTTDCARDFHETDGITRRKLVICSLTIRNNALYLCAPKSSRTVNLICRTEPDKKRAMKKRSGHKVRGVSPGAERESMMRKICERGRSWAGSGRERELWMVRVVSWQWEDVVGVWTYWCWLLNPVYTIQPVVKPVVQPVWQPAVSCKQTSNRLSNRLSNGFDNRFDNRLYRVNGALSDRRVRYDMLCLCAPNSWLLASLIYHMEPPKNKIRSIGTALGHTSDKARLTSVAIRIRIRNPDRHKI